MARDPNASYEGKNQRTPISIKQMQEQIKELQTQLNAAQETITQLNSDLGAIGTIVSVSVSTEVTTSGLSNETICKITLQPGIYIIQASSYIPAKCRYFAQINSCHSSADDTVGYTGAEVISIGKFTSEVTLDYKLWLMNVSKECTISSKVVAIRIK